METPRFAAKIVAVEILLLLALGVLVGSVGLEFGSLDVDVIGVITFLAIVGIVVGTITAIVTQRRRIAEGAQSVADDPTPVIGVLVVAVLAIGTVAAAVTMIGPSILGLAVGAAVAAGLVAGVLYEGPRIVVDRPWIVAGGFVGAVVLLFAVGAALGQASLSVGGLGVTPGPVVVVLLVVGALAGAAFGAFHKQEEVRKGAQVVAENRYPVLGGLIGGFLLVVAILVVLGAISIQFGGIGVTPGPVIIVAIIIAVLIGGAYGAQWYRTRDDEAEGEGEQAEA